MPDGRGVRPGRAAVHRRWRHRPRRSGGPRPTQAGALGWPGPLAPIRDVGGGGPPPAPGAGVEGPASTASPASPTRVRVRRRGRPSAGRPVPVPVGALSRIIGPDGANSLRVRPLVAGSGRGRLSTMRSITIVEVIRGHDARQAGQIVITERRIFIQVGRDDAQQVVRVAEQAVPRAAGRAGHQQSRLRRRRRWRRRRVPA